MNVIVRRLAFPRLEFRFGTVFATRVRGPYIDEQDGRWRKKFFRGIDKENAGRRMGTINGQIEAITDVDFLDY